MRCQGVRIGLSRKGLSDATHRFRETGGLPCLRTETAVCTDTSASLIGQIRGDAGSAAEDRVLDPLCRAIFNARLDRAEVTWVNALVVSLHRIGFPVSGSVYMDSDRGIAWRRLSWLPACGRDELRGS
jgi:hypothetical protein